MTARCAARFMGDTIDDVVICGEPEDAPIHTTGLTVTRQHDGQEFSIRTWHRFVDVLPRLGTETPSYALNRFIPSPPTVEWTIDIESAHPKLLNVLYGGALRSLDPTEGE